MRTPVVINGRATIRREIGGVERVARELSFLLPRLDPARYRVATPPRALAHRAGHVWEQTVLPALPADIVYCPAMLGPVRSKRNVVCIHDAASVRHPEWYSRTYAAYQRRMLPKLARRARLVITVSQFARAEVIEVLGADPDRVEVVRSGVSDAFRPGADAAAARAAFGLDRPYVLTVGSLIARKNHARLIEAYAALRGRLETSHMQPPLVLAGGFGWLYEEILAAPERAGVAPHVRILGAVPDADLPLLLAGAGLFVYPSLYEGFGLPVLEALACAVPVVASDTTSIPEVLGDAGLYCDPLDSASITRGMADLLLDSALAQRLRAAGPQRAAQFSWERAARETLDVYEHVSEQRARRKRRAPR